METESEKYDRILNILRRSKPVLGSTEEIEENVISRILKSARKQKASFNILDYLFAWVYIGWIRGSLVAASVLLMILFGYQQGMMIKQIHTLNDRTLSNGNQIITGMSDEIRDKLLVYSLTDSKLSDRPVKISNRQMRRLIESVNELQIRYNDLMNLINENPELKKYINERITENNRKRFKL